MVPTGAAELMGRRSVLIPWQEPMCFVLLQHLRLRSCRWEGREEHHGAVPRRVCAGHLQAGEGRHAVRPGRAAGRGCVPQRKCPEQGLLLRTHQALRGHHHGTHSSQELAFKVASSHLVLPASAPPFPGPFGGMRKQVVQLLGFHTPTGTKAEAWVS